MTPDITLHNPDPAYLRGLIEQAGISQREAARRLGITDRVMRCYLADRAAKSALPAPYLVQFGLERLAENPRNAEGGCCGGGPDGVDSSSN